MRDMHENRKYMAENRKNNNGKSMAARIFGNWIVRNLLLTAVIAGVLIAAAMIFLNIYTRHDKELQVPDFYGMTVEEATALAASGHIRVEVADSIYVSGMERGAIYRQVPKAGSAVKKNRRILLTINATHPKTVTMPDLIGFSMRQARAELSSKGLETGQLIYKEDIATNNVLGQRYRGRDIKPGTRIQSGSSIDLVLGLNPSDNETYVPDIIGTNGKNAVELIQESSLNISKIIYAPDVKDRSDSTKAIVYRQIPSPSEYPLEMGTGIIIYLTTDRSLLPAPGENGNGADSLSVHDGIISETSEENL